LTENLLQITVIGILAVIFSTTLKKYCSELSLLLTIGASIIIGIFLLQFFHPILSFAEELRDLTGLDRHFLDPVIKCLGIGLLSQICMHICIDAGQNAIGKMIQICGCLLCLYISLPIFRGVLSLIGSLGS